MIGYPCETITGARLPSGRDVMKNFIHYHRKMKLTVSQCAHQVYDVLLPFWNKSRLPVRHKPDVVKKIKDLYYLHGQLMKNRKRNNDKDQQNQKEYSMKLDNLFDISDINSNELIKDDEDREFLRLQQESRTGCIGSVDNKTFVREKRTAERKSRLLERAKMCVAQQLECETEESEDDSSTSSSSTDTEPSNAGDDFTAKPPRAGNKRKRDVVSQKVAAVLDRTNTSIRTSTMILASLVNQVGCSTTAVVLSKSSVHRQRQRMRQQGAKEIKADFQASKSVVHWDSKLLPDLTGVAVASTSKVERLPVIISSLADGTMKLLGVPQLASGSGHAAAKAVLELLKSWNCDSLTVGMCFDTTAANTGRHAGACTLLETFMDRHLLWMACRHHMCEVLLSDVFSICFGPSSGPEILFFKRFREKWHDLLHHEMKPRATPLIHSCEQLKKFITEQLEVNHPRDDYREFLQLAGFMVGLTNSATFRKPGAIHRARWMAKAIYTMKIELLLDGNESVIELTVRELQAVQRFNRFVVIVYLQSWFTCRKAVDAAVNDIQLIQRLNDYDDSVIQATGLKMMERHSWYLSQELATLALFSQHVSSEEKTQLVSTMKFERGLHLIKPLPLTIGELTISRSFFETTDIDDSFLNVPVSEWSECQSYKTACEYVHNLPCVNDCAERGVALMQHFNATITKKEEEKQFVLQVVEKHRQAFPKCNRQDLANI